MDSRTLWVSPINSPVRLGVSPAGASTPTGVFSQRFEASFPRAGALGWMDCLTPHLPVYQHTNVGLPAPPTAASPAQVIQLSPCHKSSLPWLLISIPPTSLKCFFNSLVVGFPYSLIFWQFWLFFVFKFVVVLLLVVGGGTV